MEYSTINPILHVQRAFLCQVPLAEPTTKEGKFLTDHQVTNKTVQSYFVWRKSCLITAMPTLIIGFALAMADLNKDIYNPDRRLNGLGILMQLLTSLDNIILFGSANLATQKWYLFSESVLGVQIGFSVAFIMPLIPALFPIDMLVQPDSLKDLTAEGLVAVKIKMAVTYAFSLFPVIITLPGGALRGSLRIRWLLPESTLSGWIIVMSAPLYSIVTCMAQVIVIQTVGNKILIVGTTLIVTVPLAYLIFAGLFVSEWDTEKKEKVQKLQKIISIASITGYVLVLYWVFTTRVGDIKIIGATKDEAFVTYSLAIRTIIEMFGRLLVTTVMFSDLILGMSLRTVNEMQNLDTEVGLKIEAFNNAYDSKEGHAGV